MRELKQGELVTVNLGEQNHSSNTYQIARKIAGESVLSHPLYPECFIIRPDAELDTVLAQLRSPTEHCLEYASKYKKYLAYDDCCDVEALCLYFVVQRKLSARQKKGLANLCGTIAAIYCQNDISVAVKYVTENLPLLDAFNRMWYDNFEKLFDGSKAIKTPKQRAAIFNIAGFVLAQVEGK